MDITIQNLKDDDWIYLHDFYSDSPEPDAPKTKFEFLSTEEKDQAKRQNTVLINSNRLLKTTL